MVVYVCLVVEVELCFVIDNLMVFLDGCVEFCGNFYGVLVVFVCDFFVIVIVDVGLISEWCIDWLLDVSCFYGLLLFMVMDLGVDFGLMLS